MLKFYTASLLTVFSFNAFAQSEDTIKIKTVELSEIVIKGNTADKTAPISYYNIPALEIKQHNFGQEPSFILAQTPSITMHSDAGSYWGYSYIRLRGIDQTRINMTLNGVPLNEPEDQGVYFSNYPDFFQTLRNIQIQRGTGMSKNGTSSFAGSMIFESEAPEEKSGGSVKVGVGSFGSKRITGAYQTGNHNGLSAMVRESIGSSYGYKVHSGNTACSFFLNSTFHKKSHLLKLIAFAGNQRNQLAWLGVPMDTIKKNPRFNQSSDENDNFTQAHLQLHYQYASQGSQFNTCVYYNYLKGNYDFDLNNFLDLPRNNEMYNYALKSNFLGWFSNYTKTINNLTLSAGIHLNQYTREHIGTERTLGWLYTNTGYKNELSGFLRASHKFGKLNLYGDIQYRHADFEYHGDHQLPSLNWNFINYTTGINYQVTEKLNFYYSFGKTNREPTRNDIFMGNDNLITDSLGNSLYALIKPEKALDHEVGMRFTTNKMLAGINFYYISFKNEIALNGEVGPTGLPLHSNSARSYRSGLEIDFKYKLDNGLSISTNASFSNNRIKDSGSNLKPILSPAVIINPEIGYHFKNIMVGLSCRYQGKAYIDYGNAYTIPAFFIMGYHINYTYKWLMIYAAINNLTNRQYFANGNLDINNRPVYFVQAPINYFGGITCTF